MGEKELKSLLENLQGELGRTKPDIATIRDLVARLEGVAASSVGYPARKLRNIVSECGHMRANAVPGDLRLLTMQGEVEVLLALIAR